jgi:hypothetical protein
MAMTSKVIQGLQKDGSKQQLMHDSAIKIWECICYKSTRSLAFKVSLIYSLMLFMHLVCFV